MFYSSAAVSSMPRLSVHETKYSLRHHSVALSQLKLGAWGSIPHHYMLQTWLSSRLSRVPKLSLSLHTSISKLVDAYALADDSTTVHQQGVRYDISDIRYTTWVLYFNETEVFVS